jgi:hypothetical protein
VVLMMLAASAARAATILSLTDALTAADPTQLGRLSRNGVPQDWAGTELFPGVLNTTTAYHYDFYTVNVGITPFIQINIDSLSPNTFVSAYDTAYLPPLFSTNWLGDAGFSENPFPPDPAYFNVVVPVNHNLVIVVNQTVPGTVGLGEPYSLLVEGFIDTEYTDPPDTRTAVPEPATLFLSATGLGMIARKRRVRRT